MNCCFVKFWKNVIESHNWRGKRCDRKSVSVKVMRDGKALREQMSRGWFPLGTVPTSTAADYTGRLSGWLQQKNSAVWCIFPLVSSRSCFWWTLNESLLSSSLSFLSLACSVSRLVFFHSMAYIGQKKLESQDVESIDGTSDQSQWEGRERQVRA